MLGQRPVFSWHLYVSESSTDVCCMQHTASPHRLEPDGGPEVDHKQTRFSSTQSLMCQEAQRLRRCQPVLSTGHRGSFWRAQPCKLFRESSTQDTVHGLW